MRQPDSHDGVDVASTEADGTGAPRAPRVARDAATGGGAASGAQHGPVTVRPRRMIYYGAIAAAIVLASMIVLGLMLTDVNEGIQFRAADQAGLISVGVFGAAVIMLVARPRATATEQGILVRNILGETFFSWSAVVRIAFPPGAHWAQVVLDDDERHPLMAIQALDTERAVASLRAVRAVYDEHRPPRLTLSEDAAGQVRRRMRAEAAAAAARPLGRLEQIDRQMAALPPRNSRGL